MKKFVYIILCLFSCISSPLVAKDDLIQMLHLSVEIEDVKLYKDVIEAILKSENHNKNLLEALAKYSEKGKIEFALHNAIKNKDLLSSVILVHYLKDVNTKRSEYETVWSASGHGNSRPNKVPIELALEANMVELIPYLLMKNAIPYNLRQIQFFYEGEENLDYLEEFGCKPERKVCVKSKKAFFPIGSPVSLSRAFVGDMIAKNRLDVIEMLQKMYPLDWNKICCNVLGANFTPLQFALFIERYEIAQFLIDHGAKIE